MEFIILTIGIEIVTNYFIYDFIGLKSYFAFIPFAGYVKKANKIAGDIGSFLALLSSLLLLIVPLMCVVFILFQGRGLNLTMYETIISSPIFLIGCLFSCLFYYLCKCYMNFKVGKCLTGDLYFSLGLSVMPQIFSIILAYRVVTKKAGLIYEKERYSI